MVATIGWFDRWGGSCMVTTPKDSFVFIAQQADMKVTSTTCETLFAGIATKTSKVAL
jgi:hypothetical protein